MSVKDQLEQSHVDGSHTTVKSKRSTNTGVVSQFNKEAAWQVQQYGNYEGAIAMGSISFYLIRCLYGCLVVLVFALTRLSSLLAACPHPQFDSCCLILPNF